MTSVPLVVQAIRRATVDAVEAARLRDRTAFETAVEDLAAQNQEQVGRVLGAILRMQLEETHQDGLTGEDVQAVLTRCVRTNMSWLPDLDVQALALLLTGALGVHPEAAEVPPPDRTTTARHAPLLVADLLTVTGRPVGDYLDAALTEIATTEAMELP